MSKGDNEIYIHISYLLLFHSLTVLSPNPFPFPYQDMSPTVHTHRHRLSNPGWPQSLKDVGRPGSNLSVVLDDLCFMCACNVFL